MDEVHDDLKQEQIKNQRIVLQLERENADEKEREVRTSFS